MATNQFLPFGIGAGANVLSPAAYAALTARTGGFTSGTAKSQELNSVWRQAAFGVSALAQFIADQSGDDVLDDGNIANFKASLIKAINLLSRGSGYGVDTGSANVYQVAFTPAVTGLVDGLRLRFRAKTANTGASTFSPNGVSAAPIWSKKHGALTGGEIIANGEVEVVWNAALNTTGAWVLLENTGGADQLPAGSYGTNPGFGDSSLAVPTTDFVQQALGNILSKSIAGNANITLTATEGRYSIIELNGAITGNIQVIFPASPRQWLVLNNTSGSFSVTCKTASGSGVVVEQSKPTKLYCDGTKISVAAQPDYLNTARIDVSAATTINLNSISSLSRNINIVGSGVAISDFAVSAGQLYFVRFAGACTLVNSASLVTQTGANVSTTSGDTCVIRATAANVVEVMFYTPYAGWANISAAASYQKLPSGKIIQYGKASNPTAGEITVVYPLAFSSAKRLEIALPIVANPLGWDVSVSKGDASLSQGVFVRRSGTTTGNNLGNFDIYWLAIGE
ncbi:gp53-like domain-containing protein [Metapseudomonas otitidis]|uniref:gp53-like domain-containing protein n=1 Tax=Metapseudomonas otitidis TaxID=319939 RepID=UPI001AAFEF0E|nr:hypothetical protein [Pseudomonas otitidis]MBO2926640.1 hypothetical protein [Pseudomonas otitidis]